jgi:hypothetical protein
MRSLSLRFLVAFSILFVPVLAFATNVTVSGTTTFAALDGGPNDADHSVNGVFTVNGDLTINGKITCSGGEGDDNSSNNACAMKFAVSGNLVMNAGSSVSTNTSNGDGNAGNITFSVGGDTTLHGPFSNQTGSVVSGSASNGDHSAGGNITITGGGKITTEAGSVISAASQQGPSGKIVLTAGGKIDLSGLIASGPSATLLSTRLAGAILSGGDSQQHGGEIRIQSNSLFEPGITVGSSATIVSQGETTAAGPVTLEGCGLIIKGLVAAVLDKEGVERVVLRSGKGMTIDATDLGVANATMGRLGHIRADSLGNWQTKENDDEENNPPAPSKTVDLFSNDAIQILGPDPALSALYAVTSVPNDKDHKQDGGRIRAISLRGTVTGSGRVFLAGQDSDSNNGGTIAVSSMGNVNLDHGFLSAIGDATKLKKDSSGGHVTARSYSGNVVWTSGRGDVRPVGSGASGVAAQGTIALTACGTVSISGTTFPGNGPIAGVFPTIVTGSCSPSAPTLPAGEPALQVCCNVITITNPSVTSGPAGVPFSQTFTQTGALGTATFSIASGTLPAGLTFAATGTLSGTPTVTGTFPITVKVTDSQGCTGVGPTYNLQIVCPTITVTNPSVSSGVAAAPFSQTFTQSGGVGATTFSLASGTLPTGLSLSASGTLSGTPTKTGTFPITVKATDANGCTGTGATYTLTITCQTITVTNPAVSSGVAAAPFSQTFTQSGGIGATTFSLASGSLPTGITLAANGTLSGTPTQTGSFPITIKATDSNGCSGTGATYTLTITCQTITVTNPAVSTGVAGSPFSRSFTQSGAIGTATFTLASGTLPAGLTLSSSGVLSGTPTQTGTFPITVKVTDSNGCSGTGTTYNLTITCQTITVTAPGVNSGVAGSPFSQTFTQSGAIGTATFTLSSGTLPSGLSLSPAGVLSGTPMQTGTFPINVKVTDSNGCTGTAGYTLTIVCQTITVTPPAVNSGVAAAPFSQTFTQSGAIGTASFTTSSTLPTGLSLSTAGVLSGTPTQTGTFPITVTVTDSNGCTGSASYTLTITCQTITVTPPSVTTGVAGTPFSQSFTQSGAIGTATFTLASGALPAGMSLAANGTLSGTPLQVGSFPITVTVTDSNGCTGTSATYTLVISCQTITVTNPAVSSGVAGTPFNQTFTQSGGIGTTTFTIASGTLPTGLTLAADGTLSGTPTQTGSFPLTVTATDSNGCSGTGPTYTLTIGCQTITVTNPAVSSGVAASPFSQTFTQSGGIGTTTFSLASGTLPAGLALAANGVLSGTPTQTGSFPITVKATDSNGCSGTGATYTLVISCQIITVTNPAVSSGVAGSPFSQTFTQSGAIGTASFTLASGTLPAGLSLSSSGVLSGTPTQTGTFPITIKVTDSNGCTGTGATYNLTITCQTITVTAPGVSSGVAGSPFSQTFTQSGAIGTATFTLASGTLPSGLSLSSAGVLSGTPLQTGTFPITVKVTDSNGCSGTVSYALTIVCQTITVTPPATNSGVAGAPFSQTFTESGAIGMATFTTSSTLPTGLSLSTTGVLSGTPTQTGTFPITVTVTDSNGCTGSASYTLTITCQTITVTPPSVTTGVAGTSFSQSFTQSGAIGTATFSLASGSLPAGMSLAADGTLSGTPMQVGSFPITVTVTDSNGCTGTSATYTLVISCQTITVTHPAVMSGTVGSPFSQQYTQSGGIGAVTFSLTAGTLPTGMTLAADGTLSGTPTQSGTFPITVTATDSNGCTGSDSFTLTISCQTITVTNPAVTTGTVGTPFSQTFTQSGGIGATTFSLASGSLPTGLSLGANGVLSGTPTQSGSFAITVKATDSNGCSGTGPTYTLVISCQTITVTNPGVTTGSVGTPFSQTFTQSGGIGAVTFSVASGSLPPGLTLAANGTLSGTPTTPGAFTFTVRATDANGCSGVGASYTVTICAAITFNPPAGTLTAASYNTAYSQTFTPSGGVAPYTLSFTGTLPPGLTFTDNGNSTATVAGTPTNTGSFSFTVSATDANGCPGSANYTLHVRPKANADSYSGLVNNTQAYVSGFAPAPGTPAVVLTGSVLANDLHPAGTTVTTTTVSTTAGGSITFASDGTFLYTPPVAPGGPAISLDTASYSILSNGETDTATVTLNLANRVWYVKNDVGGGNGQSQSPFGSLGLAASASTPNDIIFVYRGDGTATGQSSGIILKNGQSLIGQRVALIVNGNLLVAAGTAPLIGNGAGNVVTLATGNTVSGLTINATTGAGILGAGITSGTTTVSSVTLSATGVNNGVSLSSNPGSTFNFAGISISSATGTGFLATGGGTVSATGTGNTIAAAGGTALNVTNTTIGASGMTFASIAATGGTSGIVLNNTGTSGGLTVTGDGPSDPANTTRGNTTAKQGGGTITIGSGGTIQNTSLSGILLTNTNSVSLTSVKVLNAGGAAVNTGNNGITANTVSGLVLDNVLITGSTGNSGLRGTKVTNLQVQHTNINGNGTVAGTEVNRNWNVRLDDLAGNCGSTCNWQNSLFFNSRSNVVGLNQGSVVTNVNLNATITNCEFRDNTTGHSSPGNDAFVLSAFNSAVTNLTVTGSTFKNVEVGGFQYDGNDNSGGTVNVRNSIFELNGSDVLLAHGGGSGGNATLNFDVSGNTMRQLLSPNSSVSVNLFLGGLSGAASLMSGTVKNNVIGNAGVTNSGSVVGDGIDMNATGAGTITATVTGNTVHQIQFGDAFLALADSGSAKLNLFVHSNNFNTDGTAGNSLAGIDLISGAGSDTSAMCVDMALNIANGDSFYQGATVSTFGGVGATIKLLGLSATFNNNASAIANFIGSSSLTTPPGVNSSVNPTPTVGGGAVTITGGGTIVGTGSCGSFPP